jgi:hypothetical protein
MAETWHAVQSRPLDPCRCIQGYSIHAACMYYMHGCVHGCM